MNDPEHVSTIDGGPKVVQVVMHSVTLPFVQNYLDVLGLKTVRIARESRTELETWTVVPREMPREES